jgi:hypothetical protein
MPNASDSKTFPRIYRKLALANAYNESNLQTMLFILDGFWSKNEGIWQQNGGPMETILHFALRFYGFLGFFCIASRCL